MGALKIVGGIFSLVGGVLVLLVPLAILLNIPLFDPTMLAMTYGGIHAVVPLATYINIILAALAIVGGILGMAKKRAGGALSLVAAIVWMLGMILITFVGISLIMLTPYSALLVWTGIGLWLFTIESIVVLLGGIFILAGGSD